MRFWIETGFLKADMQLSPLLRFAMDMLDQELERYRIIEESIKPGDMAFCNNRLVAHNRRSFVTYPGDAPRHSVRAWIQTQKV